MSRRLPLCLWCNARAGTTIDHLIPKWALLVLPELRAYTVRVSACANCNNRKGPMPPAVYASLRHERVRSQGSKLGYALRQWNALCNTLAMARNWDDPFISATMVYVKDEMLRPLPEELLIQVRIAPNTGVDARQNPPHSKNPPLRRIYTLGHVDGLARWEALNPLAMADRR